MQRIKIVVFLLCLFTAGTGISCVSMRDKTMTQRESAETEIIDTVSVEFTSYQILHIPLKERIREKAYIELKKAAAARYGDNVDVKNIVIQGTFSPWEMLNAAGGLVAGLGGGAAYWFTVGTRWAERYQLPVLITSFGAGGAAGSLLAGNTQKITAAGDIVENRPRSDRALGMALEEAITTISGELIRELPENATVAVISVSSNDRETSILVVDELEYHLVDARKFIIVDRKTLDAIRGEQNLQMSGDVSDDSAVSIGQMLGASIVITGTITESGANHRLSLRALDVTTSQIITMARETY